MTKNISIHKGVTSNVVVLSDTASQAFDAFDSMEGKTTNDYCRAFHVNESGTLHITDETGHECEIYVNKGQRYDYGVQKFWLTGTATALQTAGMIVAWR